MKSSTLRRSLGSIHWSGLKVPPEPSPRLTCAAILQGRSETSKFSIRPVPLLPSSRRCQVSSAPLPSGVTMPMPVTTTRRIRSSGRRSQAPSPGPIWPGGQQSSKHQGRGQGKACASSRLLFEKLDGVADGEDGLGGIVGNLATELFLEGHDQLDGVEAVGAEIIDEARLLGDLFRVDPEVLDDDFLHPLGNVAHRSTLLRPFQFVVPPRKPQRAAWRRKKGATRVTPRPSRPFRSLP